MEGTVTWPQAVWIITLLAGAAIAGFMAAWRIQILRSRDQLTSLEQVSALKAAFETRIASIEVFNAGTMVVLEHMKEFRDEIKAQFEALRKERASDMEGIHRRLDFIHNEERLSRIAREEKNARD